MDRARDRGGRGRRSRPAARLGCAGAALFELDGFGRAGAPPRESYLLALAVGFAASLMVPMVVWRLLLPRAAPGLGLAAGLTAAALIATILGLSGRR